MILLQRTSSLTSYRTLQGLPFWLSHVSCPCGYPALRRDLSPIKGRPFEILVVDVWPRVLRVLNGSKVVNRAAVERSVLMLSVVRVCGEVRVPSTDITFEHIHISINYSKYVYCLIYRCHPRVSPHIFPSSG